MFFPNEWIKGLVGVGVLCRNVDAIEKRKGSVFGLLGTYGMGIGVSWIFVVLMVGIEGVGGKGKVGECTEGLWPAAVWGRIGIMRR